jgi:hypothetical protein
MKDLGKEIITKNEAIKEMGDCAFMPTDELKEKQILYHRKVADKIFEKSDQMTRDEFEELFMKTSNCLK